MKVRELVVKLSNCPQEAVILMSSDAEGNAYHNTDGLHIVNAKEVIIYPMHDDVEPDFEDD